MVNAHGCGLTTSRALEHGTRIRLEIVADKRSTTARVVEVVLLAEDCKSWLIGLELEQPGNFWGIQYAPADWAEAISSDERGELDHKGGPSGVSQPHTVRTSQCRLTAISAGACYLQSTESIPVHTRVIVRVRLAKSERSFNGIVRIEHARSGMGIEFIGGEPCPQDGVEDLIRDLKTYENVLPEVWVETQNLALGTKPSAAPATPLRPGFQDSLLGLILIGSAISRQDFLRELERQRSRNAARK